MAPFERLVLGAGRSWAVAGLRGRVLEIGAGTGMTLPHYSGLDALVLTDRSARMLARAAGRAAAMPFAAKVVTAYAEHLPFASGSFDGVVATLALCTVDSPRAAFREIRRVLRAGGELRLFEHVRVPSPPIAALQDLLTPGWRAISGGCHLNRDTLAAALEAGFSPVEVCYGMGGWLLMARLRSPVAGSGP